MLCKYELTWPHIQIKDGQREDSKKSLYTHTTYMEMYKLSLCQRLGSRDTGASARVAGGERRAKTSKTGNCKKWQDFDNSMIFEKKCKYM